MSYYLNTSNFLILKQDKIYTSFATKRTSSIKCKIRNEGKFPKVFTSVSHKLYRKTDFTCENTRVISV